MSDVLMLERRFLNVAGYDLIAPFADLLESALRGRENSVVLSERRKVEELRGACNEAVAFAQQMPTGRIGGVSPHLLALAEKAVQQCALRKDEDVQAWAERLARDVGNATD
jgi:hypothetical protein